MKKYKLKGEALKRKIEFEKDTTVTVLELLGMLEICELDLTLPIKVLITNAEGDKQYTGRLASFWANGKELTLVGESEFENTPDLKE